MSNRTEPITCTSCGARVFCPAPMPIPTPLCHRLPIRRRFRYPRHRRQPQFCFPVRPSPVRADAPTDSRPVSFPVRADAAFPHDTKPLALADRPSSSPRRCTRHE